jgi:hypothetical protein
MTRLIKVWFAGAVLAAVAFAFQAAPLLSTVDPDNGKVGDTVSAKGQNLGKKQVCEMYLTDGKHDFKASILDQADEEIKFKVPKADAGRYHLMVLDANRSHFIEQPVVFTIGE